ncbi:MAG TPA: N-acetylmuramoyl-L-alanine amidase [Gemmatimonadaceae bacterium]|nr:N-acetylmuramoyl-L-alanine amidase [Gemmatimonadaceae bacterium]
MIGALLVALQLASTTPSVLSVRAGDGESIVPLVETNLGAAIPIERLSPLVPLEISDLGNGRFAVKIAGIDMELSDQLPFARVSGQVIPLAAAPFVVGGHLHVPFEVVAELLPRIASDRLRYNPGRAELRYTGSPAAPTVAMLPAAGATEKRAAPTRGGTRTRKRLIIVDAGHGGPDNGMRGPIGASWTIYEKNITLAVSQKLDTALRARGMDVVMTRTRDTLIALDDRGRIANEVHGDVFVSIHVNAANLAWHKPAEARGYETYFLAEAKTEDARRVERMENESVHFETNSSSSEKDDPLNFIKLDMAQNEHLRESSELAAMIQRRLGLMHPGPSRGVKQAGFRVLVTAYMPAVLVEIGFGTNAEEARFITNPEKQRDIANAVAAAVGEYLDHYERRLGSTTP